MSVDRFDVKTGQCERHGETACPSCLRYALEDVRAERDAALEALRKCAAALTEVEWAAEAKTCPDCGSVRPEGHAAWCGLSAALTAARAALEGSR